MTMEKGELEVEVKWHAGGAHKRCGRWGDAVKKGRAWYCEACVWEGGRGRGGGKKSGGRLCEVEVV